MPKVAVSLLGSFRVETEAGELSFPTRKTGSLLAYLILHPEGADRSRLAGTFWPDVDDISARRNLRTTLWRLSRTIAAAAPMRLILTGKEIALVCDGADIDVLQFKESLRRASSGGEERFERLRLAESLYKGDLLEDRLEEWCEDERRALRGAYVALLKDLSTTLKEAGEIAEALGYALKVVEMEPLDEDAQRELMILLHLAGRSVDALTQFERLRELLKRELGVSPSQATLQTWEHIRSNRNTSPTTISGVSSRGNRPQPESGILPLIGRESTVSELSRSLEDAAHGRSSAAIILGETGAGKTKLIEAMISEAGLRGFDVLHGQCPDLQNPRPYHVFIQALWQRILDLSHQTERATALTVLLRPLMPDPRSGAGTGSAESPSGKRNSALIVEAFLSLLAGGTDSVRPMLLVMDDIHWIDGASASLLVTLLGRLSKQRLFILLTMRSDDPKSRTIASALIASGAREIHLRPLSQSETRSLTRSTLGSGSVSSAVAKYVWERSNGIPLFAIEFLKYLRAEGLVVKHADDCWMLSTGLKTAETSGGIPSRVQEIVRRRIESLDADAKRVLLTSSVFAAEVHLGILGDIVAITEDDLADVCGQLVSQRLLRETEHGFQFGHDVVRHVASEMVGKARLRMVHARLGRLLEERMPSRVEDLAWHFEMAGDVVKALAYAEASGDKARSVHANADATAWYSKALELHDKIYLDSADCLRLRASLLQKRQDVLDFLGDRDKQGADIAAIYLLAHRLGDKQLLAESLSLRANLLIRLNAAGDALKCARLAGRYLCETGDHRGIARSHETAGLAYESLRRYSAASAEFKRAQEMFRRAGDRVGEARGLVHIGVCHGYSNRNVSALRCMDKARHILEMLADRRGLAMVFLQQGVLYRFLGQLGTSESQMLRAIGVLREVCDRIGEARSLGQLAVTHAAMGRLREAAHECEGALRVAREAGDVRALIMTLNNAAFGVHRLAGSFFLAQRYVHEALRLVSEAGNVENSATYEDTMAAILLEMGRPEEALHWSRRAEARYAASGSRSWPGIDIYMRLGAISTELGRHREARYYLQLALRQLGGNREPISELLISTEMAKLSLARGDLKGALRHQRHISTLLRQIDGIECIQKVYWTQFCVLKAARKGGGARRALRRAAAVVIRQASALKTPMRKRFLAVKINSNILREFWGSSKSVEATTSKSIDIVEMVDWAAKAMGLGSRHLGTNGVRKTLGAELPGGIITAARRSAVLELLQRGGVKQQELASRLGVSARTVRNDIAALRRRGLITPLVG